MQIYIYREDFFYNKILATSKSLVEEILKDKSKYYTKRKIPKKNGFRTINCLEKNSALSKIQQSIRINFLNTISIPNYVYGFVSGQSYSDYLKPHVRRKYYLRLDIKNFFENITNDTLESVFSYYFRLNDNKNNEELLLLIDLITLDGKLPQGAITSPTISNIVFRQLDIRINKYCKKFNINYSRYADDLLFSTDNKFLHNDFFIKKIKYILSTRGFELNKHKIRYDQDSISLNGFVIEDNIRISRSKLKGLSSTLFIIDKHRSNFDITKLLSDINNSGLNREIKNKYSLLNYLAGYRAFLLQFLDRENPEEYYNKKVSNYVIRIQNSIELLRG
ncbi:reverse transcriptase family protein [Virgibacillus sp. SK37]|uniref:reverse transcriptase family protein n=1 Tax=Virgibacillus sp. SK37 TaxID=403957 RepID=UPI0004D1E7AD|nr:reverse transcriptase family protein [Virgibacillus sp. SK37]AIF42417.1 reverse transcriptase [Virgibacillus sp. SK37]